MISGVNDYELEIIKNILKKYNYQFYFYGSRVKGDFTKSSDLDILLKSDTELDESIINKISYEFNISKIPYVINISEYSKMDKYFFENIKNSLVELKF